MRDFIGVLLLLAVLKIRWAYFHVSPRYVEFRFNADSEAYFQNTKTGAIHCQISVEFNEDSCFYKWSKK